MVPDWDEDSDLLQANLRKAFRLTLSQAERRILPNNGDVKLWHSTIMVDLRAEDKDYVGRFRGEADMLGVEVRIGRHPGVESREVAGALAEFYAKLERATAALDPMIAAHAPPKTADSINAVIELCAWVHAEWVRIHPFANGNGRTARLWAAYIAMRYGIPPFVRLRPRPGDGYALACEKAMTGDWKLMASVFRQMYLESLKPA